MYKPLQGITPYQYNIEIIRGFFKKPLILVSIIVSILTSAFTFLSFLFTDFFADLQPIPIVCGAIGLVFSILVAFSLIKLYLASKSHKHSDKLTSSVKLLSTLASIHFIVISVFSFIVTLFSVFLLIASNTVKSNASSSEFGETFPTFAELIDKTNTFIFQSITLIFLFATVAGIILFLYSLTNFLFINSVKKSVTSIFLKKTGATAYGVLNIIFFAIAIFCSLFFICQALIQKSISLSTSFTLISVSLICFIVSCLLNGILAIKYGSYIKKHINGQTLKHQYKATTTQQPYSPPVQNDYYVPVNQTVMENPDPAILTPEKNQHLSNNAYVRAENYNVQTVDDIASKPSPQQPKNEKQLYNETDSYLF